MSADTTGTQEFSRESHAASAFSSGRNAVRPSYFGPSARRLFGVYEALPTELGRGAGVVLCYPHGRDYVAAFRAFRVLSSRLAAAGFHVLRFDYSGTGDSWGEAEDGSVAQWTDDIVRAIDILRAAHGCPEVSLVGLRLGAALAALAAVKCQRVDQVVLWEPVCDGRAYVRDLHARHAAWLAAEAHERRLAPSLATDDELLGYRFTGRMERDLESVSLQSLPKPPAPSVHVVAQEPDDAQRALVAHVRGRGGRVSLTTAAGPKIWSTSPGMEQGLVPNEIIRAIVDALAPVRR